MTRIEYDLLLQERPDLKLPTWEQLLPWDRDCVENTERERIIAHRTDTLLSDPVRTFQITDKFWTFR